VPGCRRHWACGIRAIFAFPGVQLGTVPAGVLSRPQRHRRLLSAAGQDRVGRYARTATVLLRAPANVNDAGQVSMSLPENASEVQQAIGIVMEHATVDAADRAAPTTRLRPPTTADDQCATWSPKSDHLPFSPTTPT
jgi:hypothetical protein